MIVSITDQVLIVCPTVRPKYSFTTQKPASCCRRHLPGF